MLDYLAKQLIINVIVKSLNHTKLTSSVSYTKYRENTEFYFLVHWHKLSCLRMQKRWQTDTILFLSRVTTWPGKHGIWKKSLNHTKLTSSVSYTNTRDYNFTVSSQKAVSAWILGEQLLLFSFVCILCKAKRHYLLILQGGLSRYCLFASRGTIHISPGCEA